MSVPYVDHAYRHLPGGTDPLEIVAGGSPSYAYCFSYVNPETIPAGGSLRLANEDFYTNALGTVFSTGGATTPGTNATGDLYLHFHAAGLYIVYGDVFWDHAAYEREFFIDTTCTTFNQQEMTAGAAWSTKYTGSSDPLQERPAQYNFVSQYTLDNSPTYRHRVSKLAYNNDAGADHDVLYHTLAAIYWPMDNDMQNGSDTDLVYES